MPIYSSIKWPSLVLTGLLAVGFVGVASACPGKKCADGQCEYKANNIAKKLGLEGERAVEVEAIQENYRADKKAIKERMHEQVKLLNEDYKNSLMRVLTPEEYAKFEAYMAYHKAHGYHSHGEGKHYKQKATSE